MRDLDRLLDRLAADSAPPDLAASEAAVLRRVEGYGFGSTEPGALRIGMVAAALLMGVIGGALPETDARMAQALAPLAGELAYAPSTLLVAAR